MEDKNVSFEKYFLKYKNLIIRVIVDGSGDYQLAQEICQLVYENFIKIWIRSDPEWKRCG